MNGKLVIVGTPIGNLGDMSPRAVEALRSADVILCEDTRHTLKLLNYFEIKGPKLVSLHEHNEASRTVQVIDWLGAGQTIALVSDAGMPGVSDPGQRLVAALRDQNLSVSSVPGPTAAITALAISGIVAERFSFEGFLPRSGKDRKERLDAIAIKKRATIIYESPQRLLKTLSELRSTNDGSRRIAICRELTKLHEEIWRGTLGEAVDYIEHHQPRGEYTLVLEGAVQPPIEISDQVIIEALQGELAMGKTKRDAVAAVTKSFKLPRGRVYGLANKI